MPITLIPIRPKLPLVNRAAVLRAVEGAVRDTTAEGVRFLAEYPPAAANQRYVRTGTLKRSWSMKPVTRTGDRIVGEVGSNSGMAPYNRKVQGQGQDAFFRRRGWRNTDDGVRLMGRDFPRRVQRALNGAVD